MVMETFATDRSQVHTAELHVSHDYVYFAFFQNPPVVAEPPLCDQANLIRRGGFCPEGGGLTDTELCRRGGFVQKIQNISPQGGGFTDGPTGIVISISIMNR